MRNFTIYIVYLFIYLFFNALSVYETELQTYPH